MPITNLNILIFNVKETLYNSISSSQCLALKLMVRWLLGIKSNDANSGTSTLRLLYTIIVHEGDLMEKGLIK